MTTKLILIIEDNDDDVLMIKRGFKKANTQNKIHRVTNGKEAIQYLLSDEDNIEETQLILLDLNMEIMNGFDFLKKRMNIAQLKLIPAVVLTSSTRNEDIKKAYELGANSYVEKQLEPKKFIETILSIENFWIKFSKIPEIKN